MNNTVYVLRDSVDPQGIITPAGPLSFNAQNSGTVTATIRDQRGVLWINATISAVFKPSPFGSGEPVWTGGPIPTPVVTKSDQNGFFSITLPASTSITPSGSQWAISICPDASFACTVIVMAVTPGTIDISGFITSQLFAPDLVVNAFPLPRVYDPEEARGNPPLNFGAIVANTTTRVIQYWDGTTWETLGTTAGAGFVQTNPPGSQTIQQPQDTSLTIASPTNINDTVSTFVVVDGSTVQNIRGNVLPSSINIDSTGSTLGWNLSQSDAETSFINVGQFVGSGGFSWWNTWIGGPLPQGLMQLFSNGALQLNQATSSISIGIYGNNVADSTVLAPRLNIAVNGETGRSFPGNFVWQTRAPTVNSPDQQLSLWHTATDTAIGFFLAAFSESVIELHAPVTMDSGLDVTGTKNFKIPHPLDSNKYLVHSCVEGPEAAVFYRGEGITIDNFAVITLPDYFEALTRLEGRTVQLTALFEDDDDSFGNLAASRVINGQFKVRSFENTQRFYWEVKAIRADVPELVVEVVK